MKAHQDVAAKKKRRAGYAGEMSDSRRARWKTLSRLSICTHAMPRSSTVYCSLFMPSFQKAARNQMFSSQPLINIAWSLLRMGCGLIIPYRHSDRSFDSMARLSVNLLFAYQVTIKFELAHRQTLGSKRYESVGHSSSNIDSTAYS